MDGILSKNTQIKMYVMISKACKHEQGAEHFCLRPCII